LNFDVSESCIVGIFCWFCNQIFLFNHHFVSSTRKFLKQPFYSLIFEIMVEAFSSSSSTYSVGL
jgi:hypothetical protein